MRARQCCSPRDAIIELARSLPITDAGDTTMDFDTYFHALEVCSECLRMERARVVDSSGAATVFEVNREWIFRVPTDADGAAALAREHEILALLRPILPVAVPDHRHVRMAADGSLQALGSRRLPGRPLEAGDVQDPAISRTLGEFLSALHAVEPVSIGSSAADGEVLVHGRLAPEHLLCTDDPPALSGVIGWSGVYVGDPAIDLAPLLALGGESGLERVLEHYDRPADPGLVRRVRSRYNGKDWL